MMQGDMVAVLLVLMSLFSLMSTNFPAMHIHLCIHCSCRKAYDKELTGTSSGFEGDLHGGSKQEGRSVKHASGHTPFLQRGQEPPERLGAHLDEQSAGALATVAQQLP